MPRNRFEEHRNQMTARQRRETELLQLEERATVAETFDDLAAVVVDLLRRLRHENHEG